MNELILFLKNLDRFFFSFRAFSVRCPTKDHVVKRLMSFAQDDESCIELDELRGQIKGDKIRVWKSQPHFYGSSHFLVFEGQFSNDGQALYLKGNFAFRRTYKIFYGIWLLLIFVPLARSAARSIEQMIQGSINIAEEPEVLMPFLLVMIFFGFFMFLKEVASDTSEKDMCAIENLLSTILEDGSQERGESAKT